MSKQSLSFVRREADQYLRPSKPRNNRRKSVPLLRVNYRIILSPNDRQQFRRFVIVEHRADRRAKLKNGTVSFFGKNVNDNSGKSPLEFGYHGYQQHGIADAARTNNQHLSDIPGLLIGPNWSRKQQTKDLSNESIEYFQ
jgi:hypothetical protein